MSSTTLTEDQSCSISVSESVSRLDSISLTVSTPGQNCSFNVTSLDAEADSTECRSRRGEEEGGSNYLGTNQLGVEDTGNKVVSDVFTCVLDHLEPGTAYQLQIQSQTDDETANLTLHTSKSSSRHTTYTLDNKFSTQGPLPCLLELSSKHSLHPQMFFCW